MKHRVILIYPEPRLDGNYPHGKGHAYTATPPVNLLSIAYFLQRAGYQCDVLDAKVDDFRKLDYGNALCVGISSMSGRQLKNAVGIAKELKSAFPALPLVWGGVHPSLVPESTAKHPLVDFVVRGEGEDTMVELAHCIRDGKEPTDVQGVSYQTSEGSIRHNPDRAFMDLNRIGVLPYELIDLSKYPLRKNGFPLNTSRGCPFACRFCYNLTYNKRKWRSQEPEKVMESVRHIVKTYGITNFMFQVDDEFFIKRERVEAICKMMLAEELNLIWSCFCRADHLARFSDEFMQLIHRAGCREMFIGGESGSRRMLKVLNKGIVPEDLINASIKCRKHGISPTISFMTAFPGETQEDREETWRVIDRLHESNPDVKINGIFSYSPYPGTPLFEEAKERGLKEFETLEDWMHFKYDDVRLLPWLSPGEKSMLFMLSRLVKFPFLSRTPDFPHALRYRGLTNIPRISIERLAYMLLRASARIRWKRRFFGFAPEWRLWCWYAIRNNVW